MLLYIALILFFSFFYTAIVFNPVETADNLANTAASSRHPPGKNTSDYLELRADAPHRIGSAYLAVVCILPSS